MKKAVLANRIYLTRVGDIQEQLSNEMTYKLPSTRPGSPPEVYCDVTRVTKDIISIPSGRVDMIPDDYEIVDKRVLTDTWFPEFKPTLYESQREIFDKVEDSCIICANPGWGKTFTSTSIIAKLEQKALVIVHTSALRDQWVREIEKSLSVSPGVVSSGKYNVDPPIVVATKQSLSNRLSEMQRMFGTVIVDECHHVPASVFKGIVDKFSSRYKIGLTATLWRKDGKHVYLPDYFSKTIYKAKDERRLAPTVKIIPSNLKLVHSNAKPWAKTLNELMENPSYRELVLNISKAQAERGFKVLTVSDRVEFLENCAQQLDNSTCIVGTSKVRTFDPKLYDILFGSIKIFSEGVDIPILSSVVLATPINNRGLLEQLIGRITRLHPDKKNPEIIDIALGGKTGKNQLVQRIKYYTEMGYKIEYL